MTAADLAAHVDRFTAISHTVVRFVLSGDDPWPRFDPAAVLAHPDGRPALRALARHARRAGWGNRPDGGVLFELFRGVPLDRSALAEALGASLADRLRSCGVLLKDGHAERWNLGFGLVALDEVLAAMPRDPEGPEQLYLGAEALWIERWRAELGFRPARVVELGCGAGHLTAVLAAALSSKW